MITGVMPHLKQTLKEMNASLSFIFLISLIEQYSKSRSKNQTSIPKFLPEMVL